ncbi:Oidioi.mRNA.OKI2018_I69.PAR.g10029.t2.cds [Oikopleura dioica]|uniref:Oidioi.mRNA.OKI2018_I69.PAR.g10029.t2.cds n=1 Tax=Oikopleura dioica TaxID=34765 RepID=A0ABN7RSW1_OIKDI|nr:Oidioi.mRNA.OKI2018_I69.PAR.g10029.t2.cds [Oikopleura dioica]
MHHVSIRRLDSGASFKRHSKPTRRTTKEGLTLDNRTNAIVPAPLKANRARINVSGTKFETFIATLEKYPDSLLGNREKRQKFFDAETDEYFFDRNPECFKIILERSKNALPGTVFAEHLKYNYLENTWSPRELSKSGKIRKAIWDMLEKPQSSTFAFCFSVFIQMLILLSILIFVLESLPEYRIEYVPTYMEPVLKSFNCEEIIDRSCSVWNDVSSSDCQQLCLNNSIPDDCSFFNNRQCHSVSYDESSRQCVFQSNCKEEEVLFEKVINDEKASDIEKTLAVFSSINAVCIAVFTIEIILRLIATPKKEGPRSKYSGFGPKAFFLDPLNIIDLLAVLPFYIELVILQVYELQTDISGETSEQKSEMFRILRIIRLIRVIRILRFSRYNQNLQTLGRSLLKSTREIGFLIMFYLIFSILCATIAFYVENEVEDTGFDSIPSSLWWAIVTMTTVGYGDMFPVTGIGRFIGCIAVFCGILCVALPIPFISNAFEMEYKKVQIKSKFPLDEQEPGEDETLRMRLCMYLFELQMEG